MESLQQELHAEANKPKTTAVQYSKQNQRELTAKHGISRQQLRQEAVIVDQQVKAGLVLPEMKLAKASTKPKSKKAKAEAPKKPKAKAKTEKKPKPKSKKKS